MAKAVFNMVGGITSKFVDNSCTKEELRNGINENLLREDEFIQLNAEESNDVTLRKDKIIAVVYSD